MYGDFFGTEDVAKFEELLTGLKYEKEDISRVLMDVDITSYFGKVSKSDLLDLLIA